MLDNTEILRRLKDEAFALAATQCDAPIAGEHGHMLCEHRERVKKLEAAIKGAIRELTCDYRSPTFNRLRHNLVLGDIECALIILLRAAIE